MTDRIIIFVHYYLTTVMQKTDVPLWWGYLLDYPGYHGILLIHYAV